MHRLGFSFSYILWHYTVAIGELIGVFRNFLWAEYRLFSIPVLLKTLFSPWHRLGEQYKQTIELGEIIGTFIVNSLMRLIGAIVRLIVVLLGVVVILLTTVFGCIVLAVWLIMPVFIFALFIHGILILIS